MTIDELTDKVSLLDYVRQYVPMKRRGNEWFGRCPFHSENTASFSITEGRQVFYCFGCGARGNILTFIQKYHNLNTQEAVETLVKWANANGVLVDTKGISNVADVSRKFNQKEKEKETIERQIFDERCMNNYVKDADELNLWRNEGISDEALDKFLVRFDRKTQRIVFPLRDNNGNIIGLSGRTTDPQWKEKGLRKYTYTSKIGAVDFLYGLYENRESIKEMEELIVFEGAKSVMKAMSFGVQNSAALLTSHLNDYQTKIIVSLSVPVVFALDKEVDIREDKNIARLKRFVPVWYLPDTAGLLGEKEAPVDRGKEVFAKLYQEKRRWI